jgi:ribosomal protein S18 acetylase RimI-like enzyme
MTIASPHRPLRVRPWAVDPTTAHLVPYASRRISPDVLRRVLRELADAGYRRARTAALTPSEQRPFLDAGFEVDEHLHLLVHDLQGVPAPTRPSPLRRARRRDRAAVLTVDHAAFSAPWRLDDRGLAEALAATPSVRFRVAGPERPGGERQVLGYAVAGRAGPRGYLQRVAVHPESANRGLGRVLVGDALWWLHRRGARRALVNTQEGNDTALHLYEAMGFRPEPEGLDVLGAPLA